jgi:membrane-associated phospholipid phosphatase
MDSAAPSRRPRLAWAFVAAALALFALLAGAVALNSQPYFSSDLAVSLSVLSADWPWMDPLMRAVSLAGDNLLFSSLLVVAACVALLALRAWREAVVLLGVVLVGQVLKVGLKLLIARERPSRDLVEVLIEAKEVHSFPSGHTVHYTVFFGFLWYLTYVLVKTPALRWPLLVLSGGMVLLVGVARIYLGAHWVSDIVGGYLLGGAVLAAGILLYRSWTGGGRPR